MSIPRVADGVILSGVLAVLVSIALLGAPLAAAKPRSPQGGAVLLARLPRPVLAIAFVGTTRVLLLEEDRASLWRLSAESIVKEAEHLLPAPAERVRWPGGLLIGVADGLDFWALRSGWPEALLLTCSEEDAAAELTIGERAAALPWPGASNGLRFRAGTNILEGEIRGLGRGPFLAVTPDGAWAVDPEGRLEIPGQPSTPSACVGSVLTHPWPEVAFTTSPTRPEALIAVSVDGPAARLSRLADIAGSVRALATHAIGDDAVVLLAVDEGDAYSLQRLDVGRRALGGLP
jgi:hypothetical protein